MSHASRRPLVIVLILLSLSLPLAAQPRREKDGGASRGVLSVLWDHLTASLSGLWSSDSAAGPQGPETSPIPPPESAPTQDLDGRSVIDPLG